MEEAPNEFSEGNVEPSQSPQGPESENQENQDIVDLDRLDKFKYGGKEWTKNDWKSKWMPYSDYQRKITPYVESHKERRFYDNLQTDLETVKNNPQLLDEFKKVYPEKFHAYLKYVQQTQNVNAAQKPQGQPNIDPAYLTRLESVERALHEKDVQGILSHMDGIFPGLQQKYPLADEASVLAVAQGLVDQKNLKTIDDKMWEQIFKSDHEKQQKRFDQYNKNMVTKQKTANLRGKDTATGGGIPAQAPKRLTLKEVKDHAIAELSARNQA